MEQSKSFKNKKKKIVSKSSKKTKKDIWKYIDKKLDELGWDMGERNISNREELYDR